MKLNLINLSSKPKIYEALKREINRYRHVHKIEEPEELKNKKYYIAFEELSYVEKFILSSTNEMIPALRMGDERNKLTKYFTNLKSLSITNCTYLAGIELEELPNKSELRELEISDNNISSIDLSKFTNLKYLSIRKCPNLKEIKGLDKLKNLDSIELYGLPYVNENDVCKLIAENIKNRDVELSVDALYYPRITELIRQNYKEYELSFRKTMWIEEINSRKYTKQIYSTEQLGSMYADITEISKELEVSSKSDPVDKIYIIYNWLCNNITYDDEGRKSKFRAHSTKHTTNFLDGPCETRFIEGQLGGINGSRNALRYGTSVCQGYTKLFQMFLKVNGITSYDVAACLSNEKNPTKLTLNHLQDSSKINHSIIKIKLPNGYYYCDTTNDAVYTQHRHVQSQKYFLRTLEELDTSCYPINDSIPPRTTPISEEKRKELRLKKVERKKLSEDKFKTKVFSIMDRFDLELFSETIEEAQEEYRQKNKIAYDLMLLGYINNSILKAISYELGILYMDKEKNNPTKKR